ncbi:uncharacterized protein LOC129591012 isoform X2 [Paramacrobiotus metropolitanus]|nr:uncharacterized protein LOC129591012 isoform X2 [Paramacrobiotus metropolitanus]
MSNVEAAGKLSNYEIGRIRDLYKTGKSASEISKSVNVPKDKVEAVIKMQNLSSSQTLQIAQLLQAGKPISEISRTTRQTADAINAVKLVYAIR